MPINYSKLLNSRPRIDSSFDLRGDDFKEREHRLPVGGPFAPVHPKACVSHCGDGVVCFFFIFPPPGKRCVLPQTRAKFVTGLESRVEIRGWESFVPLGDHSCGVWMPQSRARGSGAPRHQPKLPDPHACPAPRAAHPFARRSAALPGAIDALGTLSPLPARLPPGSLCAQNLGPEASARLLEAEVKLGGGRMGSL